MRQLKKISVVKDAIHFLLANLKFYVPLTTKQLVLLLRAQLILVTIRTKQKLKSTLKQKKTYIKNIQQKFLDKIQQEPADNLQILITTRFQRIFAHKQLTVGKVAFANSSYGCFVV